VRRTVSVNFAGQNTFSICAALIAAGSSDYSSNPAMIPTNRSSESPHSLIASFIISGMRTKAPRCITTSRGAWRPRCTGWRRPRCISPRRRGLDPTNPIPRLNLAVVRLQGTNAQDLALARTALKLLCAKGHTYRPLMD
jgi:hypothetical protein